VIRTAAAAQNDGRIVIESPLAVIPV